MNDGRDDGGSHLLPQLVGGGCAAILSADSGGVPLYANEEDRSPRRKAVEYPAA